MLQMLQVDRTNQLAAAGHLQRLEQERLGQNHRRAASIELESKVKIASLNGLGPNVSFQWCRIRNKIKVLFFCTLTFAYPFLA